MPFLLAERARSECARSMRAVKGSLGPSPKRSGGGLEWLHSTRADGISPATPYERKSSYCADG